MSSTDSLEKPFSFSSLSGTVLLFGGTFDPIHLGHLQAASAVKVKSRAQSVVLIPTHKNPLKHQGPIASDRARVAMINLAISNLSDFYVSEIECDSSGDVYTIDTIRRIKSEAPSLNLQFLVGADLLTNFHRWKTYEAILEEVQVWVVGRDTTQTSASINAYMNLSQKIRSSLRERFVPFEFDASSTDVRAGLSSNAPASARIEALSHLPPKVGEYIASHRLYA